MPPHTKLTQLSAHLLDPATRASKAPHFLAIKGLVHAKVGGHLKTQLWLVDLAPVIPSMGKCRLFPAPLILFCFLLRLLVIVLPLATFPGALPFCHHARAPKLSFLHSPPLQFLGMISSR